LYGRLSVEEVAAQAQGLEEFVPSAADAIEVVKGRVVLVDGTLTPCWSYEEHQELWNKKHKTTGFNAQLISFSTGLPSGFPVRCPGRRTTRKHSRRPALPISWRRPAEGSAIRVTRALAWSPRKRSRQAAG
jgi:hypothetical protein